MATRDGASAQPTFFCASYDVWRRPVVGAESCGPCPSMFPFELVLRDLFVDNGERRALPPSYDVPYSDDADIRAQCTYLLRIVVERKGSKLGLWKLPKK